MLPLLFRRLLIGTLVFTMIHTGCAAYSPTRKVGHGGEKWSLADIFPAGPNRDLAAAAAAGDRGGIERAVKAGAQVNFRGTHDLTPLWWASWDQNLAGFTRLLELGADPNIVPTRMEPVMLEPVMHQIVQLQTPIGFLRAALRHGGNPDLHDRSGRRVIHPALILGTREHVDTLLAAGINVNRVPEDGTGSGPLHTTVMARHYDYALLFLEKGADPREKSRTGNDLATFIGQFPYNPNGEQYEWRERVIRFLRKQGIEAQPPPNEGKRTKPLPADLR
jgi:ankyrin repeat protein